jgi:Type IV secretion system pilin
MIMKKKLAIISLAALSFFSILIPLAAPSFVLAATSPLKDNVFNPLSSSFAMLGPLTVCVGAPSANSGSNNLPTCSNLCDLVVQIAQIIYFGIAVVIWIIVPISAAAGGIMIMLGGASSELVGRGKKTITGAVWGLVIVLCAWLIVYTFVGAFGGLSKFIGFFPGGPQTCSVATNSNTNNNTTNTPDMSGQDPDDGQ